MAELKTKSNERRVADFFREISDETVRGDCEKIAAMMERATGAPPKMWGAAIVGFGTRRLPSETGRGTDWMEIGFAPRKQNLTLYLTADAEDFDENLLSKLGKFKTGKGCLYFKRLSDVDETVLNELIEQSVENIRS